MFISTTARPFSSFTWAISPTFTPATSISWPCPGVTAWALENSANTLVVASKKEPKQYAACVVKATRRLDVNHVVRRLLGVARLSFASADGMGRTKRLRKRTLPSCAPRTIDPTLGNGFWRSVPQAWSMRPE